MIKVGIKKGTMFVAMILLGSLVTQAQRIKYTEPDREDSRNTNFEIIGKVGSNILIYKNNRFRHVLNVFDQEMKLKTSEELSFLNDRVFNVDFLPYQNHSYIFYQYQRRSIVYCMAAKLDADGKKIGDSILLDTTDVSYAVNNKIYSFIHSEDKQKIMFVKVNSKDEKVHVITSVLFNQNLDLIQKERMRVSMPERGDYVTEFSLSNNGDLHFLRAWGTQNDNITKLSICSKLVASSGISIADLTIAQSMYLDDVKVKEDNLNQKTIITSFYSKKRRGDIEGLYSCIWDNANQKADSYNTSVFDNDFRFNAKGDATAKMAFNDYYIKHIVVKKDGGFIVSAQAEYTSTRGTGNGFNRWDNFNNGFWGMNDFYTFGASPFLYASPWNMWGRGSNFNVTRYYSDNIAIMSFDNTGKLIWSNVIYKSQFDDNTDMNIGFGLFNSGNQIHYLFNQNEKRQSFLTDQSITPEGQLIRNATLKDLDKGFEFLPRYTKQIGSKQIIVPCMYRNYLCFAKIDF